MNHCRASSEARLHGRRNRSTALTRLTGVAILLMAAIVWPMAVFAADPAVDTQRNAAVVFIVIMLLFGSVTAGLFFASPLRRRFEAPDDPKPAVVPGAPPVSQPLANAQPAPQPIPPGTRPEVSIQWTTPVQPPISIQPATPEQAQPPAPHRPAATPWSTGSPQADFNWNPQRRRRPEPGF